ncbi:U3 small nucleolar ribonucleoprotein LCP5-like protein [Elsinoe fawcettii]|nr:U3 small nucleolar ribonucleoprotein LCP5-like protein [Elsinoe fawcettii]
MPTAAVTVNVEDNLASIQASIEAASSVLPTSDSILPPENGISLLDAKNEIFLSYLQSLALRNLEVIRSVRKFLPNKQDTNGTSKDTSKLQDEIVEDLVKQRVYLEKGVRPLEDRLKYTIDKTLRAAEEQERKAQQSQAPNGKDSAKRSDEDSGSESDSSPDEEDVLALGPNRSSMLPKRARTDEKSRPARGEENKTGVYKPPRITATSMPDFDRRQRSSRNDRPDRSRTLDEYVSAELTEGPAAQPSIGANIAQGGRRQISAREREKEQERREYEETNLVRLPKESKKDRAKKRARDGGFGGEDWRGLGDGLDRIDSLTRGTKRKKESALEKSRKRLATQDGQRDDGVQGGLFEKRRKRMSGKLG